MSRSISFFIIATKSYVDYARDLINDFATQSSEHFRIQIILLTDDVGFVKEHSRSSDFFELKSSLIPSYGWPEATLYRFQLMSSHKALADGEIIAYIDADMRVSSMLTYLDFSDSLSTSSESRIALVRHPGYSLRSRPYEYLSKSSFGPWGINRSSTAWVSRKSRSIYVCGGLFWGEYINFFDLCSTLADQVALDESRGVRAKHNDESHLNKWSISNRHNFMGPEWVYAPGYRNLRHLTPIFSVIHKPLNFDRILSNGKAAKLSTYRKILNIRYKLRNSK